MKKFTKIEKIIKDSGNNGITNNFNNVINESNRDFMISVISNILKGIKSSDYITNRERYLMINHVISEFSEKLFTNKSDSDEFYYNIVKEQEKFKDV